ncbi:MAG: aspartate--tRNA(Asn) ligase [Candidatus Micrarchaeota archaeon]
MLRTHYIGELNADVYGKKVALAGWVHEIRDLGSFKFVILRDKTGLIQITVKKKEADAELLDDFNRLVKETCILCTGVVQQSKIANLGAELFPEDLVVLGEVLDKVPFELTGKVPAELDVRLDNRFVDLRRKEPSAIFKIRHTVQQAFREFLLNAGFQEINTPTIVSSSTEGGADLFPVIYFEKQAYLAQSPQLYKQLAVVGGMDKVFMTQPVFRAEKHNTTVHLNEVTQMDAEMGFCNADDAVEVLEKTTLHILKRVHEKNKPELEQLSALPIKVPLQVKQFTYNQVIDAIKSHDVEMNWGEDFPKEVEAKLPVILGEDLFFIREWPTQLRAFYSMPMDENPEICHAYDLVFKGLEIASGAQRIHVPSLLVKQLKARGLKPVDFQSYIDAFKYGAPPHAGWSIGAERIVMKLTDQSNIRECSLFPRDRHRLLP